MRNADLAKARERKQDEFYTQYSVIQKEVNAYLEYNPDTFRGLTVLLPCDDPEWSNFTKFFAENFMALGLKKLISTSYSPEAKRAKYDMEQPLSSFEKNSEKFDESRTNTHGRIFVLERDLNGDNKINIEDLEWEYLEGDGDFRSDEIRALRDEADIIVTNPPFSLFREFVEWVLEANKKMLIIGSLNSVTYKEFFPLIRDNEIWLGVTIHSGDREFGVPPEYPLTAANYRVDEKGRKFIRVKGVRWYTNLEHGLRHKPLNNMSMKDQLKYNKHAKIEGISYKKYDNYDAIEVPFTDAIPGDYEGMMGVPISFIDKYCPEEYELLGITQRNDDPYKLKRYNITQYPNANDLNARAVLIIHGIPKAQYPRILIRKKK